MAERNGIKKKVNAQSHPFHCGAKGLLYHSKNCSRMTGCAN